LEFLQSKLLKLEACQDRSLIGWMFFNGHSLAGVSDGSQ
jgi:hypothetical protein